ncbi:thiamine phosphate synthase [Spirosoma sordidisoli]|uniref:Thiamine-phosphate synthase n=1 Tax=Spirosoma sordidisoli TaxID=2502893 RepID=A0A4Q2UQI9_9BACT|nr:thiamine phosphate synthase [Spirosoma sordidisoli]RYC71696.1 thiamine phosphate synthase [Spirosoma sordidisoli]
MKISQLHYIVTQPEQAEIACRAGVDWIQLRLKNRPYADWKAVAQDTLAVCRHHNARLIINDNPILAGDIGADGVHLGQDDMPVPDARALLGDGFLIGGTANRLDTILTHYRHGVDYVGLGPFRFTTTKEKLSPILGLAGYQAILSALQSRFLSVPIVAIGGITLADVPALMQTGLHGIALSSAISGASDPARQTRLFLDQLSLSTLSFPLT